MPSALAIGRALKAQNQAVASAADTNPMGLFGGQSGYGAWMAGTPGQAALPRPIMEFLQGAFGPGQPIPPMPIDVPQDESGRPAPRRWQYPVYWNLPIGVPGSEGIKVAAFAVLTQYADHYSVIRSCLRVRKEEIIGIEWDIVPTKAAEKAMRADNAAHKDFLERRNQAVRFWRRPDSEYDGFSSWLSTLLEEIFVTDASCIHLLPTRKGGKGLLGSDLAELELIDGTTIRPLVGMRGGRPKPPSPAFQQYIWGVPRVDLMQVLTEEDALEAAGGNVEKYTSDQLLYMPYVRRVRTPYGFSPVEQALIPAATGLKRQTYMLDYFTEGSIPGMFVIPGPDVASATQRRQLQDTLNAISGDIGYKHKIIVLPPHSEAHETKDIKLSDGSDQIIAEMVMMTFAVQPEEIAMVPGGRTSGLGGKGHAEEQAQVRRQQRTKPLLQWLKASLFDRVIQDICGQHDMEWAWVGLEETEDEEQQAKTRSVYVDAGILSRDEARLELSLPPWNLPLTSSPTVTTMTGPVPLDPDVEGPTPQVEPEQALPPSATEEQREGQEEGQAEQQANDKPSTPDAGNEKDVERLPAAAAASTATTNASARQKAALAELDQLRGYLRHGKPMEAFKARQLPEGELQKIAATARAEGIVAAIAESKERIRKADVDELAMPQVAADQRDRRDQKIDPLTAGIAAGLGALAASLLAGKLSTLTFVDQGAQQMASAYRAAYAAGAADAGGDEFDAALDDAVAGLANEQHGYLQGLAQDLMAGMSAEAIAARMVLYGSTMVRAYELGYRAAQSRSDDGQLIATWHCMPDACPNCRALNGRSWLAEEAPLPGNGGYGGQCRGGPRCRCVLSYSVVPLAQVADALTGEAA